jgi:sulfur carrier protein
MDRASTRQARTSSGAAGQNRRDPARATTFAPYNPTVTMNVTINGISRPLPASASLAGLLAELELPPDSVVAEVNGEIVAPEAYAGRALAEGDLVELIRFVGGG